MPLLDLSFILDDALIAGEAFRVIRRAEAVDAHGRSIVTEQRFEDVTGGVSPVGPNELTRDPERDYSSKEIMINTRFRLQLTSPGFKPDLVEWPVDSGNLFLVNHLEDFSSYGAGFISARAVAFDPAQLAPPAQV